MREYVRLDDRIEAWRTAAADGDLSAGNVVRILTSLEDLKDDPGPWGMVAGFRRELLRMAVLLCKRYGVPVEDLLQKGIQMAVECLERWDPSLASNSKRYLSIFLRRGVYWALQPFAVAAACPVKIPLALRRGIAVHDGAVDEMNHDQP